MKTFISKSNCLIIRRNNFFFWIYLMSLWIFQLIHLFQVKENNYYLQVNLKKVEKYKKTMKKINLSRCNQNSHSINC